MQKGEPAVVGRTYRWESDRAKWAGSGPEQNMYHRGRPTCHRASEVAPKGNAPVAVPLVRHKAIYKSPAAPRHATPSPPRALRGPGSGIAYYLLPAHQISIRA